MLKSLVTSSLALTLFFAVSATPSFAANPAAAGTPQAGQQVFLKNCFACHSVMEGQQKVGPSLFHEMKGPHPKKSATEIRGILENGRKGDIGTMPSFKSILTKEDTDNLLAYLHTL